MATANFPTSTKLSEFVHVSQIERCVSKLSSVSSCADRCVILNEGKSLQSHLDKLGRVDSNLYQLLDQFRDVVACCRVGLAQAIVIFDLPEILVASPERNLATNNQKRLLDTLMSELQDLHSASELCMVLVADEQKISIWRVTEAYSRWEKDIKLQSHSDARRKEFLKKVVKDAPKIRWYCLLDRESAWIEEALKEWGLKITVQMTGEPHRDSLKNAALNDQRFSKSKIYLEVKALEKYFHLLDERSGRVARGCNETTEAVNSKWIKSWLVCDNSSVIVVHLKNGNKEALVLTRIGEALPVRDCTRQGRML